VTAAVACLACDAPLDPDDTGPLPCDTPTPLCGDCDTHHGRTCPTCAAIAAETEDLR